MNAPLLFMGIASLLLGLLLTLLPKLVGVGFAKFDKAIRKREAEDSSFQVRMARTMRDKMRLAFPQFVPDYEDEEKTAKSIRLVGIVFLVQAVAFFILSVLLKDLEWH